MNLLIKFLFIICISFSLNAEEKFNAKVGFLSESTFLLSFKDARAALKFWLEDVAFQNNGKVTIEFYNTSESLYNSFKTGNSDIVVIDTPFFIKNKHEIMNSSNNFWSFNMGNTKYSKYAQYYLIAQKTSTAKSFQDIKNKTIAVNKGNNGALIWLDKNSLLQNKKTYKKVLKNLYFNKNESTAILNVFFNKSDFAIVRKETWDIATELNPAISKKIKIVKKSDKIHLSYIGFFNKLANKSSSDHFFKLSKDLESLEHSDSIMELLKFNSIFKLEEEALNNLIQYYDEYFELKKKYTYE